MKYRLLLIKRNIEDFFMLPLIIMGRLYARLRPLEKDYKVFYFFPFYHTGGAEKVHALITKATGDTNCIIFFTRKSHNESFLEQFKKTGCAIKDISKYTDNKWLYFLNIFFRGIVSGYINGQNHIPIVFNGQCNFGYKLSPWLNKNIRQVELIHSISNFSYIRIPFLPFIHQTGMISKRKIHEHLELYKKFGIPAIYESRITYIPNASEFENITINEKHFQQLNIMYSGRATIEKRAHLVTLIANEVFKRDSSVKFTMAGDTFSQFDNSLFPSITFAGNISDQNKLARLYKESNVVLITSSTEGFPLAVIEGMAYGCAIVATPVGDLPEHIIPEKNGFLFSCVNDEQQIVTEGVNFILKLKNDKILLKNISANNIAYAQQNFSFQRFAADYQKLIYS
jgi:L-malate glycosyltransferase